MTANMTATAADVSALQRTALDAKSGSRRGSTNRNLATHPAAKVQVLTPRMFKSTFDRVIYIDLFSGRYEVVA